jgi:hypothetical protein
VEVLTILIKGPIISTDEPQTPVYRFPVFNRRNTSTPGSSSPSPSPSPSTSSSEELIRINKT